MSLQGSLDTFALPDVFALLASTHKTGELRVTGSRSAEAVTDDVDSRVWFQGGQLAGHDDPRAQSMADAVFDLLRLRRGSFSFMAGELSDDVDLTEVEPALADAQARLAEWSDIEAVVPSPDAWLRLAEHAPRAKVTVTAEQWRLLVAVGSGRSASAAVDDLGVGELAGFRAIKELVDGGLVCVDVGTASSTVGAGEDAGQLVWATPVSSWGTGGLGGAPVPEPARTLDRPEPVDGSDVGAWVAGSPDPAPETGEPSPSYGTLHILPDTGREAEAVDDEAAGERPRSYQDPDVPDWRAQMADIHDLDSLVAQPQPGGTVAAADTTDTPGREATAEPDEDGDEPLNRGLLLKFLSSVRN